MWTWHETITILKCHLGLWDIVVHVSDVWDQNIFWSRFLMFFISDTLFADGILFIVFVSGRPSASLIHSRYLLLSFP